MQAKGQVTLEAGPRQQVGIQPGDDVDLVVVKAGEKVQRTGMLVVPRRSGLAKWRGYLGKGDVDTILRELRGE